MKFVENTRVFTKSCRDYRVLSGNPRTCRDYR